jgi:hypothetical protein
MSANVEQCQSDIVHILVAGAQCQTDIVPNLGEHVTHTVRVAVTVCDTCHSWSFDVVIELELQHLPSQYV